DHGDVVALELFNEPPDVPPWSDLSGLRSYCRDLANCCGKAGGIISVDVVEIEGMSALRTIYKYQEQASAAFGYAGVLIFPFNGFYYVITIASVERGITGAREACVTFQLAKEGKLKIEEFEEPDSSGSTGRIKGWFQDPYDPHYKGPILRAVSDDEKYDAVWPDHPLTKVRQYLVQVQG